MRRRAAVALSVLAVAAGACSSSPGDRSPEPSTSPPSGASPSPSSSPSSSSPATPPPRAASPPPSPSPSSPTPATSSPDTPSGPVSGGFAVIGDFGSGNEDEQAVSDAVRAWSGTHRVDALVTAGDNVYESGQP